MHYEKIIVIGLWRPIRNNVT